MEKALPNFRELKREDGKIYGKFNTVKSVNPFTSHFMAIYPGGKIVRGKDLIDTGWDDIPNGLSQLVYNLSTGHVINIPKFKAYLPLIECSLGTDGSKIFHAIHVKCLAEKEILVYKIILKEDNYSKLKIGDLVLRKEKLPEKFNKSWKYTS